MKKEIYGQSLKIMYGVYSIFPKFIHHDCACSEIQNCIYGVKEQVRVEINFQMLNEFTAEEINMQLSHMHPLKALVPSRFVEFFYQNIGRLWGKRYAKLSKEMKLWSS